MKEQHPRLSDEMLNALIDEEFPPEEKAELLACMQEKPALVEQVCRLRELKDRVRLAYEDVPESAQGPRLAAVRRNWLTVAAGILLLITGLLVGWHLHPVVEPARFVLLDADGQGADPTHLVGDETRIVFHVTNPDMTAAVELLNEVEALLEHYREQQQTLRVEVVAHGEGLGLLRTRLSAHKARIAELAERYPNLTFVACQNTINRLRVEQGIEVVLVPQARRTQSGVAHVVRRQQEGWFYIQV